MWLGEQFPAICEGAPFEEHAKLPLMLRISLLGPSKGPYLGVAPFLAVKIHGDESRSFDAGGLVSAGVNPPRPCFLLVRYSLGLPYVDRNGLRATNRSLSIGLGFALNP